MVSEIQATSILNRHTRQDDWFLDDYSLSPYQGCPFRCVYCYTRGSRYGTHQAKTFSVKANAPQLLQKQLAFRAHRGQYGIIAVAGQEPYPPAEQELRMMRRLLEIILGHRFPVLVLTKATLVTRDLDVLGEIDRNAILPDDLRDRLGRGVIIATSISTLDERLARLFEPGAPPPQARLATMQRCKEAGFLVGVNFIPVLPFLSDAPQHLEEMVRAVQSYGLDFALVGGLTLFGKGPDDCKTTYYRVLAEHFPELVPEYRSLFRIFFAPPREYQERLEAASRALCARYGVRYGILKA